MRTLRCLFVPLLIVRPDALAMQLHGVVDEDGEDAALARVLAEVEAAEASAASADDAALAWRLQQQLDAEVGEEEGVDAWDAISGERRTNTEATRLAAIDSEVFAEQVLG
eukprot:SAG11_NODE_7256_length_1172_cov_0.956198_1_plen_110_part_00